MACCRHPEASRGICFSNSVLQFRISNFDFRFSIFEFRNQRRRILRRPPARNVFLKQPPKKKDKDSKHNDLVDNSGNRSFRSGSPRVWWNAHSVAHYIDRSAGNTLRRQKILRPVLTLLPSSLRLSAVDCQLPRRYNPSPCPSAPASSKSSPATSNITRAGPSSTSPSRPHPSPSSISRRLNADSPTRQSSSPSDPSRCFSREFSCCAGRPKGSEWSSPISTPCSPPKNLCRRYRNKPPRSSRTSAPAPCSAGPCSTLLKISTPRGPTRQSSGSSSPAQSSSPWAGSPAT